MAIIHPANFVALCFAVGSQPRYFFDVDRRPISLEIISSNAHQRTKEPWGTMNQELTNLWWDGKPVVPTVHDEGISMKHHSQIMVDPTEV